MKRIAEWFAAVGAAAGRKGKRLVAIVAAVAMLGGVAGVSATAMADVTHRPLSSIIAMAEKLDTAENTIPALAESEMA